MKITRRDFFKPDLLNDELLRDFPALRGHRYPVLFHKGEPPSVEITIDIPDDLGVTEAQVNDTLQRHNPAVQTENERRQLRRDGAKSLAQATALFGSKSLEDILAAIDETVAAELTDAPQTLELLREMAQMTVALRDARWPDLEGKA